MVVGEVAAAGGGGGWALKWAHRDEWVHGYDQRIVVVVVVCRVGVSVSPEWVNRDEQ